MPNLFESLFVYRSRPGVTPEENFLTESLAYLIQVSPQFATAWLGLIMPDEVAAAEDMSLASVETQPYYTTSDGSMRVFPDMRVRFHLGGRSPVEVLSEHKWGSPADGNQVSAYRELDLPPGHRRVVVFIGGSRDACDSVGSCCDRALTWHDVYQAIAKMNDKSDLLKQFGDFLENHGLVEHQVSQDEQQLARLVGEWYARTLTDDRFAWDALPPRFAQDRKVWRPRKGRAGVDFGPTRWPPALFAGIYLDDSDPPGPVCLPPDGLDLGLALLAKPKEAVAWDVLDDCAQRIRNADREAIVCHDAQTRNNWFKLSVRCPLARARDLKRTPAEVNTVYEHLHLWCKALFAGGHLENEMRRVWPEGW